MQYFRRKSEAVNYLVAEALDSLKSRIEIAEVSADANFFYTPSDIEDMKRKLADLETVALLIKEKF